MAAPVPSLPPDFDQRVTREAGRSSRPFGRYRRFLVIGYCLTSAVTSAVVLRGQGIDWAVISATTLGALAMVAVAHRARRAATQP